MTPTDRRAFLRNAGCGFGAVALAALCRGLFNLNEFVYLN